MGRKRFEARNSAQQWKKRREKALEKIERKHLEEKASKPVASN